MVSPEQQNAARSASDLCKAASVAETEIDEGQLAGALETLAEARTYLDSAEQWVQEAMK